ncbi:bifunctional riboflavin kinase/FAD synthetase [Chitinophagaceae bacterium LB-8]|uniref:Riboflavin biosynthesis protein n=1 Tax=Paraflavisolibacter caeni TaxID=2982496 RepID=A0A9X2XPZ0_9BACT|nr:bifunctional riboflavin kinase/FAD synthetase [Paraflavisolibacter caeni]MCU7552179.1 bifunctional riboflavin kinase/FAD synthetase [Paraflavisolibacter caeni]
MKVHSSIESLPQFRNAVLTIGTFDGVHRGHQQIINALKEEAQKIQGETIIITFHPHPRKIVNSNIALQLINTPEERIQLLEQHQIDHLVVVPFNKSFSELSADDYIKEFLINKFHPHSIIIGYDHRFGKNRIGDFKLLEEKSLVYGYQLIEVPQHVLDEIEISSTKIRNALLEGDVLTANKLLGYDFFFEGKVVSGDKLGRQLGYPTANLEYTDEDKIHLGEGVYAVYVQVEDVLKKGMLSIGKRPTLHDIKERVEVNIFDFDSDIYGQTIKVIVKKYLRQQEKYPNLDALKAQIDKDKINSLKVLKD